MDAKPVPDPAEALHELPLLAGRVQQQEQHQQPRPHCASDGAFVILQQHSMSSHSMTLPAALATTTTTTTRPECDFQLEKEARETLDAFLTNPQTQLECKKFGAIIHHLAMKGCHA